MSLAETSPASTTGPALPSPKANEDYLRLYSELGWRLSPTQDKKSSIKGFQKKASSDFDLLISNKNLFGGKFKNHEIGALTGITFFVVDSDNGELPGMPLTPTYKTTRGYHYLFRVPEGSEVRNRHKVIEDVDVKGLGGLVILPSGSNSREWVHGPDVEMADCPQWLFEKILNRRPSRTVSDETPNKVRTTSLSPIPKNERNTTLFDRAVSLFRRSFSLEDVGAEVVSLNDNCTPPLLPEEIRYIIESASSYVDVEKVEKIRALRGEVLQMNWRGTRGGSVRSILIALLTEDIDHCTVRGDDVEVSVSYLWLAERVGLSRKSIRGNLNLMMELGLISRGRLPVGQVPGTLVVHHECISTPIDNPSYKRSLSSKRRLSIGVPLHSPLALIDLNSQRFGNLGKASILVLEVLMKGPHTRREIEEKLGYKRNGANRVLQRLKTNMGLIDSDDKGTYFLVENFDELLGEEIESNGWDINEKLVKRHNILRRDYQAKQEAWDLAGKDYQEVVKTAKEVGGDYLFSVAHNKDVILNKYAYGHYLRLRAENGVCYTDLEPTEATEGDAPGEEPAETVCPAQPRDLLRTT